MATHHQSLGIMILAALSAIGSTVTTAQSQDTRPLAIHMKHWIAGTGQWRTPNPDYDPTAKPRTLGWIKKFGVNWEWSPNGHHLVGEIISISAGGEELKSSDMYTFYNPVKDTVLFVQVSRNGGLTSDEMPVRTKPTTYGQPEIQDGISFFPNGTMNITRHSNVFVDAENQLTDVYERGKDGEWELKRQWRWERVPE